MTTPDNPQPGNQPDRRPLIPHGIAVTMLGVALLLNNLQNAKISHLKAKAQEQKTRDRDERNRASERARDILMAGRFASCQLTRITSEHRSPAPDEYPTDIDQTPRTVMRAVAQTTLVAAAQRALDIEAHFHPDLKPPVLAMYPIIQPHDADPTANEGVAQLDPVRWPDNLTKSSEAGDVSTVFFPKTSYPSDTEFAVYARTDAGPFVGQKFCGVARLIIDTTGRRDFVIETPHDPYSDTLQEYDYRLKQYPPLGSG